jgi:hypothetical protein
MTRQLRDRTLRRQAKYKNAQVSFFSFLISFFFLLTKLILTTDNNDRDSTKRMMGITGRARVVGKDSTKNRKANDQHHHCKPLLARWITGAQQQTHRNRRGGTTTTATTTVG